MKVRVTIAFESGVQYEVEVDNPNDLDQVRAAMREKDAADWVSDPNFYESLGFDYKSSVDKITADDVEDDVEEAEEEE